MKLGLFKSSLIITIMLVGTLFLPHVSTSTPKPAQTVSSSPFAANIYKVGTELKSVDKGDVSTNYQANVAGWQQAGYKALFFSWCANCHLNTPSGGIPWNGNFQQPLTATTSGHLLWEVSNSGSTGNVFDTSEVATPSPNACSSPNALHNSATVPGTNFGWTGLTANFTTLWAFAPLASNIQSALQVYPVHLDTTAGVPQALIVFRLDFSYYDSSVTPTRVYLVAAGPSPMPLSSYFPVSNDTETRVYPLTGLTSGQWNLVKWNVTDIAVQSFGAARAVDLRLTGFTVQAWSMNGGMSEYYLGCIVMDSTRSPVDTASVLDNTMSSLNSTSLLLVPGLADYAYPQDLSWFGTRYYTSTQVPTDQGISTIHGGGGYAFLGSPVVSGSTFNGADCFPVDGPSGWQNNAVGGSGVGGDTWDSYLMAGVPAMGYVEQHAYLRSVIKSDVTGGNPASFVYADSLNGPGLIEAMAQGRSFGEFTWLRPVIDLYFAAESDNVGMGRFPVYVDSSTGNVTLHLQLTNLHAGLSTFVRVIRDGVVIDNVQVSVPSGYTSWDFTPTYSLPGSLTGGMDYFRYEVYSASNPTLAFSNPIIFTKTSLLNGFWLAETPGLDYGAAKSFLSGIVQTMGSLNFTVNALANVPIVTKIHYPSGPGAVVNATSWSYDPVSQILTIDTVGPVKVSVLRTDPVGGVVVPIDKLGLLLPYVEASLIMLMIFVGAVLFRSARRRRQLAHNQQEGSGVGPRPLK